jgi:hypothetical protein
VIAMTRPASASLISSMLADGPQAWRSALRSADRACCCKARPAVIAVMPPSQGRTRAADLLLCRHHYGISRRALAAAGAAVFDPVPQEPDAEIAARSEASWLAAARARHPSVWPPREAPDP